MFSNFLVQFVFLLLVFGLLFTFFFRDNLIRIFISVELIFLAASLFLIIFDNFVNSITGQVFSFFILVLAGIETAIALSIVLIYFRMTSKIVFF
jgi:NADH-quinone oxidoreductase subunit K